jgi:predicted nucleic acid-binding protein
MRVFWDTNLFIYLIEQTSDLHAKAKALHDSHVRSNDQVITSALTLGELLVQPRRLGRTDLIERYTSLFTEVSSIELVSFDPTAAELYARIRAETALRQPDAIQLACAAAGGAELFLTNDSALWKISVAGLPAIRGF